MHFCVSLLETQKCISVPEITKLLKTSKQAGTPEAGPTGHGTDVTVLFEGFELGIVAQRHTAIVAEGEIVLQDLPSESLKGGRVPDGKERSIPQAAESLRPDAFDQPTDVTPVAVP
jgi:hypothetical protein